MEALLLNDITRAVGETSGGDGLSSVRVSGISTDTRTLSPGDLFVALKGPSFDGHDFIGAAIACGAAAVLAQDGAVLPAEAEPVTRRRGGSAGGRPGRVPVVLVNDTGRALLDLAAWYRRCFAPTVVAITGSNGKTTTKDLLGAALAACRETIFSERSFNNYVGLPLTLFRIGPETRFAVLEIGTNAPHEVRTLTQVAAPDVGVVTNVSHAHLKGLGSLAGIAKEKSDLVKNLREGGTAVLNRDDPFFETMRDAALGAGKAGRVVTFGFHQEADFAPEAIDFGAAVSVGGAGLPGGAPSGALAAGTAFTVRGTRVVLPLVGRHNIYNGLAAIACAVELGIDPTAAAAGLARVQAAPMRLQPVQAGGIVVLNDTWNANPGSVSAALGALAELPCEGRKVAVLGDMLELGKDAGRLHRRAGREAARGGFDLIVAVGRKASEVLRGAAENAAAPSSLQAYPTTEAAAAHLPRLLKPGDAVLVKGSRAMELERVVAALSQDRGGSKSAGGGDAAGEGEGFGRGALS